MLQMYLNQDKVNAESVIDILYVPLSHLFGVSVHQSNDGLFFYGDTIQYYFY